MLNSVSETFSPESEHRSHGPRRRINLRTLPYGMENLLRGLLAAWRANPAQLDAGSIRLATKAEVGRQIAAAVYKGGER